MKQSTERFDPERDNRLTEFTDQVMEGKMEQPDSNADDELLGLEKTILRLNHFLPPVSLDESAIKQMQVRLNARMRREVRESRAPFWKKWFSYPARPQLLAGVVTAGLLILLVVFLPLSAGDGSTAGAALKPIGSTVLVAAVVAGVLYIFWIMRRK
ncbi:MAG: hypothetical protein K8S20_11785 [Chloroflexi bacterium]|nr:hypothetical protein [Chloroflexota bacterium]